MEKSNIAVVMAVLALILAIASMYTVYNVMNEMDNMYPNILKIERSVEHTRQDVKGIKEMWNLSRYNWIIIPTSEMEIHAKWGVGNEIASFYGNGEMAIFDVKLPLNTTYRLEIYAYSGPQTSLTRGSALEIICDEQTCGIVNLTAEEWAWEYLGTWQWYAGRHEIKIINREGGPLGDTNIKFERVKIMWLKE